MGAAAALSGENSDDEVEDLLEVELNGEDRVPEARERLHPFSRVEDLRERLRAHNAPVYGTKADLWARPVKVEAQTGSPERRLRKHRRFSSRA